MTDVTKLCKESNIIINGGTTTTSIPTGVHFVIVPYNNQNVNVSGVNSSTSNGYLDNRFDGR